MIAFAIIIMNMASTDFIYIINEELNFLILIFKGMTYIPS
ncbi:hypothetical protein SDC9_149529 [bioreactor metagenome]|uniref:Uncharacterized protein n=1 Tax=bioreactor metagenome TaxID=1076179 RepID=A0A645EP43_9ZZZZ